MQERVLLVCLFAGLFASCNQNRYQLSLPKINSESLKFFPEWYSEDPDLASPAITNEGRELVLLKTTDGRFSWMDGTVENGEPFNYRQGLQGKGNQIVADKEDFTHFAENGVHDETELRNTKIITGRSVSQITVDGRPWASSGVGFMAEDETIMSVISADNQTVKKLGLTHPDIARPLFHFWNLVRNFEEEQVKIDALIYNGHEVEFKIQGSRGWQESIFNDEILGTGHIEIWRKLSPAEIDFLEKNYTELSSDQFENLQRKVSHFHTSEMVFFYINRYGFYEGHTEYRPDPVTVSLVFGLTSIEKADQAAGGDLYCYYTMHFTQNPE